MVRDNKVFTNIDINLKQESNVRGPRRYTIDEVVQWLLVPLMICASIFAETTFKSLQVSVEFLILIFLFLMICKDSFSVEELVLLSVFVLVNLGSLMFIEISAFMLNVKQYGLAVLSIVYFKRHVYNSVILHIAFWLCILLVAVQRTLGYFPLPIAQFITTLGEETEGRPLGLFLNYHFTTFFMSVYLLGYTLRKRMYLLDYVIVSSTNVMTSLVSYTGQKIFNLIQAIFNFKSLKAQLLFVLLIIVCFLSALALIINKIEFSGNTTSGLVIFYQLTNPETYMRLLNLLPSDIKLFYKKEIYDYSGTVVEGYVGKGNELFFVTLFLQGGAVLAIVYLRYLLKYLPMYRIFILLSILHYSYLFSPLIIYVACLFEKQYALASNKDTHKIT